MAKEIGDLRGYQFMSGVDKEGSWTQNLPDHREDINIENLKLLFYLIFERQEIWYKRVYRKQPAPWTNDPILANFKFTNAYRELDRASQYLVENVFNQNDISVADLVWRIIIFRFFNQPDTFKHPKYAVELPAYKDFDSDKMLEQV